MEVSFGTGYLLTRYAAHFEVYGVDYNHKMVEIARRNLSWAGVNAYLRQGDVESLPCEDEWFDSVVNTMAFSGYPDGVKAICEMRRVLKEGGRLILIDVNYPSDGNRLGTMLVNFWKLTGDVIRDMGGPLASMVSPTPKKRSGDTAAFISMSPPKVPIRYKGTALVARMPGGAASKRSTCAVR